MHNKHMQHSFHPTSVSVMRNFLIPTSFHWQEASSVVTFKACLQCLEHWEPDAFVLENVDMNEDENDSGNLDIILKCLQSQNYAVKVFKILSSDYGLPTRRVRLYLVGFHQRKQSSAPLHLLEQLLSIFKLKHQPPESWTHMVIVS